MGMGMGMGMGASKGLELLNKEKVKVLKREEGVVCVMALARLLQKAECGFCVYNVADKISENSRALYSGASSSSLQSLSFRILCITHTPHLPPHTVFSSHYTHRCVEETAGGSQQ
jgi:hypothetical protein